jgi:hypothetical protein
MKSDPKLRRELVLAAVELMGRDGREGQVRVQGESMLPTLRPGQLLAVDFAPAPAARGDLLVFRQGDLLLVHRVLGSARPLDGRPRLRTRGDGAPQLDPAVDLDRVMGRVVAFEAADGWRSVRGGPARVYARCLAWHDLFWAAMRELSVRVDGRLGRYGIPLRFQPWTTAVDRGVLHLVHRLLFRRLHSRAPEPGAGGG